MLLSMELVLPAPEDLGQHRECLCLPPPLPFCPRSVRAGAATAAFVKHFKAVQAAPASRPLGVGLGLTLPGLRVRRRLCSLVLPPTFCIRTRTFNETYRFCEEEEEKKKRKINDVFVASHFSQ